MPAKRVFPTLSSEDAISRLLLLVRGNGNEVKIIFVEFGQRWPKRSPLLQITTSELKLALVATAASLPALARLPQELSLMQSADRDAVFG